MPGLVVCAAELAAECPAVRRRCCRGGMAAAVSGVPYRVMLTSPEHTADVSIATYFDMAKSMLCATHPSERQTTRVYSSNGAEDAKYKRNPASNSLRHPLLSSGQSEATDHKRVGRTLSRWRTDESADFNLIVRWLYSQASISPGTLPLVNSYQS